MTAAAAGPASAVRHDLEAQYAVTHWTTDDGLPHNSVRCLLQSRDGYLWVGTEEGLARYDGSRFTVFDKANTPAFASSAHVLCLAEDTMGTLWIGTDDGLLVHENGRFTRCIVGAPHAGGVSSLGAMGDGTMYVGGFGRVRLTSPDGPLIEASPSRLAPWGRTFLSLTEDGMGRRFVLRAAGLFRCEAGSTNWLPVLTNLDHSVFENTRSLLLSRSGEVFLGDQQRLWCWRDGLAVRIALPTLRMTNCWIVAVAEDARGDLWAGAQDGTLYRRHEGRFDDASALLRLSAGMSCLLADREGHLWVGTVGGGLVRLRPRLLSSYTMADGLPHEGVWSIAGGADGAVWIGLLGAVSRFAGGQFQNFVQSGYNIVYSDRKGQVWAASSDSGLFQFSGQAFTNAAVADLRDPRACYEDRQGRLWLCVHDGLRVREQGEWRLVQLPIMRTHDRPISVLEDAAGTLWIGTWESGLLQLRHGAFSALTQREGLSSDTVAPLLAEADGALWIGSDKGLNRLQHGRITRYTTSDGLPESTVANLLDDGLGWLWFLGNRGIHRLAKSELLAHAAGQTERLHAVTYGVADGLPNPQGNLARYPGPCRTDDGRLWFPTVKGVVVADPRDLNTNSPPVFIEQASADGEIVFGEGAQPEIRRAPLRLPPGRGRVVQIRFTAPVLSGAEKVRFRYRLDGQDRDWTDLEPGRERVAYYANLRPAAYRFEVHAANRDGYWSSRPAAFAFSIAPRFHQTAAFFVLCAAGLAALAAGIQAYRLRVQRKILRLEQQAALERERARIARDLHDQLGSGLARINVLSEIAARGNAAPHLEKINSSARELLAGVGEMVWAANPRNDSLPALADYFSRTAQEFLQPAGLAVRLDVPPELPPHPLSGPERHHLFLAFKEALANVLKHACATEVWIRFRVANDAWTLAVEDNGRGFANAESEFPIRHPHASGNGLPNLRHRLEAIGGCCAVTSRSGTGTRIEFTVPLKAAAN